MKHPLNEKTAQKGKKASNIVETIQVIFENRERILQDPDLENCTDNLIIFEQLLNDFEKNDRRSGQSRESASKYSAERDDSRNNLLTMLLEMMKSKIELFEKELSIAEKIQQKLIPEKIPEIPGYDLHAYYHPSKHVGGDYYDFHLTENGKFYFLIADVSGHGIPSSLVVSSMQAYIYAQIEAQKSISSLIENLNKYLIQTLLTGKFVTMFLGILDLESGGIKYINAGHNPPFILRKNGESEELKDGGPILGFFDVPFNSGGAKLDEGDILALYTDGVIEPMNKEDEEFGENRFLEVIHKNNNEPLIALTLRLFQKLREFCQGSPYQDDVTLLFIKKTGL